MGLNGGGEKNWHCRNFFCEKESYVFYCMDRTFFWLASVINVVRFAETVVFSPTSYYVIKNFLKLKYFSPYIYNKT